MSWANGLIFWLLGGLAVMWLWGEIVDRFSRSDERDRDTVAERKRRIAKRARDLSGEHK
jgi:hypothetical protein